MGVGSASDAITLPLLAGQASIWVAEQFGTIGRPYNLRMRVSLDREGSVTEASALEACRALVERHPSLRARLPAAQGVPVQTFDRPAPIELRRCGADDPSGAASLNALVGELGKRQIDLAHGPLNELYVLVARTHIHVVALQHHCVTDAMSQSLIAGEIEAMAAGGQLEDVDDLFAVLHESLELERQAASRIETVVDEVALPLPGELSFPCIEGAVTGGIKKRYHEGLADQLSRSATERGVSRLALTTASTAAAVAPHAPEGWQMGLVATTRPTRDARVVGCFVNTLPLVIRPSWSSPSTAAIEEIHAAIRRQLSHRHLPLAAWTRELRRRGFEFPTPERLVVSQFPSTTRRLPDTKLVKGSRGGITIAAGFGDELSLSLEYPHAMMSDDTADTFLDEMVSALTELARDRGGSAVAQEAAKNLSGG